MAILKSIDNPSRNGSTAEYWNVGELRFYNRAHVIEVVMHGYRDKEFREEIANIPAFDIPFTISGDDFDKDMTLAEVYTYAKTLPAFDGAIDDI